MSASSPAEVFADLPQDERTAMLRSLDEDALNQLLWQWRGWQARPDQLAPPGDWDTWILRAGRAFGKTRTGAEWVRELIDSGEYGRIALVNDTAADVRDVMVEGPSGVVSVCPPWDKPKYEPSKRRVTWPNGAVAILYAAESPEMLRGPEHDAAWCDEPAKWKNLRKPDREGGTAYDNLKMGLRRGKHPRMLLTTTPRRIPEVQRLLSDPRAVVTKGSTYANRRNLPANFIAEMQAKYEGTVLGRQELHGDLVADVEGALWNHKLIEKYRVHEHPQLIRIGIAIDPSTTSGARSNEAGIIAGGLAANGHAYILADGSLKASPAGWARQALSMYAALEADVVVAEVNQGGEMVQQTLNSILEAGENFRYEAVHATRGKLTRAEPISGLYVSGKVHHVGSFPELEDQMCTWLPGQDSPDHMDALVWLLTFFFPNVRKSETPILIPQVSLYEQILEADYRMILGD